MQSGDHTICCIVNDSDHIKLSFVSDNDSDSGSVCSSLWLRTHKLLHLQHDKEVSSVQPIPFNTTWFTWDICRIISSAAAMYSLLSVADQTMVLYLFHLLQPYNLQMYVSSISLFSSSVTQKTRTNISPLHDSSTVQATECFQSWSMDALDSSNLHYQVVMEEGTSITMAHMGNGFKI